MKLSFSLATAVLGVVASLHKQDGWVILSESDWVTLHTLSPIIFSFFSFIMSAPSASSVGSAGAIRAVSSSSSALRLQTYNFGDNEHSISSDVPVTPPPRSRPAAPTPEHPRNAKVVEPRRLDCYFQPIKWNCRSFEKGTKDRSTKIGKANFPVCLHINSRHVTSVWWWLDQRLALCILKRKWHRILNAIFHTLFWHSHLGSLPFERGWYGSWGFMQFRFPHFLALRGGERLVRNRSICSTDT